MQMWLGERSPGADVAVVSPVAVQVTGRARAALAPGATGAFMRAAMAAAARLDRARLHTHTGIETGLAPSMTFTAAFGTGPMPSTSAPGLVHPPQPHWAHPQWAHPHWAHPQWDEAGSSR